MVTTYFRWRQPEFAHVVFDLGEIRRDLKDASEPLFNSVVRVAIPSLAKNFAAQGRPPWIPHVDATRLRRIERGHAPDPTLIETGRGMGLILSPARWRVGNRRAVFGNLPGSVWYMGLHQSGAVDLSRNWSMPARPWSLWQEQDANDIQDIFGDWLDAIIARKWSH
jgi:phage gpG-like protein